MSIELKIKSKHLALEPNIIRVEEAKLKKQIYYDRDGNTTKLQQTLDSLILHRRWNVRNEARATHLARAFLAGKTYKSAEVKCHDYNFLMLYILPRIHAMVIKYGSAKTTKTDVWDWICK